MSDTNEQQFETEIADWLVGSGGYCDRNEPRLDRRVNVVQVPGHQ
jgi:hypothetical protein